MRFRPAISADVPFVVPMLLAQYKLHTDWDEKKYGVIEGFEVGYARWLVARAADERSVFLVATPDVGEEAVGFLIATIETELPLYKVKKYGFIHDIFVSDGYRHEGAARQLVMMALARFKELGISQVRCETAMPNEAARGLFGKCGFRQTAVTMLTEV